MTGHRGVGPRQLQSEASKDYSRIPLKQVELCDGPRDSDLEACRDRPLDEAVYNAVHTNK